MHLQNVIPPVGVNEKAPTRLLGWRRIAVTRRRRGKSSWRERRRAMSELQ